MMVLVDQPHTACMALALVDQGLREHSEEPFEVGFTHEYIERELYDTGLNFREALRATTFGGLSNQRSAKHFRIAGRSFFWRLMHQVTSFATRLVRPCRFD